MFILINAVYVVYKWIKLINKHFCTYCPQATGLHRMYWVGGYGNHPCE